MSLKNQIQDMIKSKPEKLLIYTVGENCFERLNTDNISAIMLDQDCIRIDEDKNIYILPLQNITQIEYTSKES